MTVRLSVFAVGIVMCGTITFSLAQETKIKKEPAPYTSAASGRQMYESYCASCHGKNAQGDGPATSALKVPPSDLTDLAKKNGGKFPDAHVSAVIRGEANTPAHGSREMPVWGPVFSSISGGRPAEVQLRVTNLTKYIESLQKK